MKFLDVQGLLDTIEAADEQSLGDSAEAIIQGDELDSLTDRQKKNAVDTMVEVISKRPDISVRVREGDLTQKEFALLMSRSHEDIDISLAEIAYSSIYTDRKELLNISQIILDNQEQASENLAGTIISGNLDLIEQNPDLDKDMIDPNSEIDIKIDTNLRTTMKGFKTPEGEEMIPTLPIAAIKYISILPALYYRMLLFADNTDDLMRIGKGIEVLNSVTNMCNLIYSRLLAKNSFLRVDNSLFQEAMSQYLTENPEEDSEETQEEE